MRKSKSRNKPVAIKISCNKVPELKKGGEICHFGV